MSLLLVYGRSQRREREHGCFRNLLYLVRRSMSCWDKENYLLPAVVFKLKRQVCWGGSKGKAFRWMHAWQFDWWPRV